MTFLLDDTKRKKLLQLNFSATHTLRRHFVGNTYNVPNNIITQVWIKILMTSKYISERVNINVLLKYLLDWY